MKMRVMTLIAMASLSAGLLVQAATGPVRYGVSTKLWHDLERALRLDDKDAAGNAFKAITEARGLKDSTLQDAHSPEDAIKELDKTILFFSDFNKWAAGQKPGFGKSAVYAELKRVVNFMVQVLPLNKALISAAVAYDENVPASQEAVMAIARKIMAVKDPNGKNVTKDDVLTTVRLAGNDECTEYVEIML